MQQDYQDNRPQSRMLFARAVRDALRAYHDPVHLQNSPLVSWLTLCAGTAEGIPSALRKRLRDAIESIRPQSTVPFGRPEWLGYRLLWSHYIQSRSRYLVCDELGLSQASYYRTHREAIEAVTSILWDNYQSVTMMPDAPDTAKPQMTDRGTANKIEDIVSVSHHQSIDLDAVFNSTRRIIAPLLQQEGLQLRIEIPPSLPQIDGDPAILRQIFLNVLTEVIKILSGDVLRLMVTQCSGEVVCTIRDLDSNCIPQDGLDTLAGFRISRSLLDAYKGSLRLEREGNVSISIRLPVLTRKAILIVDDDADTRRLYSRFLQGEDYLVQVAANAQDAKDVLAEMKPDVVVLDVLMPMEDGWDILRYLKSTPETMSIPVVICSVLSQPELALAMGAVKVLCKPIQQETLLQAIRDVLPPEDSAA